MQTHIFHLLCLRLKRKCKQFLLRHGEIMNIEFNNGKPSIQTSMQRGTDEYFIKSEEDTSNKPEIDTQRSVPEEMPYKTPSTETGEVKDEIK